MSGLQKGDTGSMDMKRRTFLKLAGLFSLAAFVDLSKLLAEFPGSLSKELSYPGRLKPLDEAEIRSMGKWVG